MWTPDTLRSKHFSVLDSPPSLSMDDLWTVELGECCDLCSVCQSLAGGSSDKELGIEDVSKCEHTQLRSRGDMCRQHLLVRAQTHIFSCAHHSAQFIQHCTFPMWAHRIDSSKRNLCCAFLCTHFHLVCHVLVRWSALSIPSGHVLKTLSFLKLVWWK